MTDGKTEIQLIQKAVNSFVKSGSILLSRFSREDLVQEVFVHFLEKKFFEKYDEKVTSYAYFIASAAKNYMIDLTRKRIIEAESLNTPVRGKDGTVDAEKIDFIDSKVNDPFVAVMAMEAVSNCSTKQISPNYDLSWKELLQMLLSGFDIREVARRVGISSARVSQLRSELFSMVEV